MKFIDFKNKLKEFLDRKLNRFLPVMIHNNHKISLKVKYRSSESLPIYENSIDYVFFDSVKHRLFFVGKSESRRHGFFSKSGPWIISIGKFYKWLQTDHKEKNNYEMYFAWNYDFKDESTFDYIPLSEKFELEPDNSDVRFIVLHSVDNTKLYRFKSKNLHENIKKLTKRI